MRVSNLSRIPDPLQRFIQSMKFLRSIKLTEEKAVEIRDRALLDLRLELTQQELADMVGVSQQRLSMLEQQAKTRYVHDG